MSVYQVTSGAFTLQPKVWVEDGVLHARTSILGQLFWLLGFCKRLRLDPKTGKVELNIRWLWIVPGYREIDADAVDYIGYKHEAWGTSWDMFWRRHNEIDKYTVDLVLKSRRRVRLYSFIGEGAVNTGWGGVIAYGDSLVDFSGNQDKSSRAFVRLLEAALGRPVKAHQ